MEPESADQYLVEEIRSGHEAAWRLLVERFNGRLLAFARARTASLSDAEDLVQETFVGFLQSLPNFDCSRSLETYLFTILRYKLVDRLRSRKIVPLNLGSEDDDWWEHALPADAETPSAAAADAERLASRQQALAEALKQLIGEYRDRDAFRDLQVIELVLYAGKRNIDVAELFDMDQKAVAGVKFRAIGKLRRLLEEADARLGADLDDKLAELTVASVWRERRLTCLKRSTLGSYLLGVLEDPWLSYTQFHLDVVGCPMCLANLQDLENEDEGDVAGSSTSEQMFASSVGFLSRASQP
jgi:RNA polymerase sigma factor (sigma-70 family)